MRRNTYSDNLIFATIGNYIIMSILYSDSLPVEKKQWDWHGVALQAREVFRYDRGDEKTC